MKNAGIVYPFGAVVGQDRLKLALLLTAVEPLIGGVLVNGPRGTGRLTAVHALADLVPGIESVTVVPSSAMAESLVGGTAPGGGFVPGFLGLANRGILYIEAVDRVGEKASDVLAGALATGEVKAPGGHSYPSRFLLVASLDRTPDRVHPALLDRFGLCVASATVHDCEDRVRILQYRAAFDADPRGFVERFEPDQARLRERVRAARSLLPSVALPVPLLAGIAALCEAAGVEGHRADVSIARTVRAIAAFDGRREARDEDVRATLELSMAHSLVPSRPGAKTLPVEAIQKLWAEVSGTRAAAPAPGRAAEPARGQPVPEIPPVAEHAGRGRRGRKRPEAAAAGRPEETATPAPAGRHEGPVAGERLARLVMVVADTSGPGAASRVDAAKKAVLSLVASPPADRDLVSLVAVRGNSAAIVLPPTRDHAAAVRKLRNVPSGGKTPLPDGLVKALTIARAEIRRDPDLHPLIVVISEGRANVSTGANIMLDLEDAAAAIAKQGFPAVVIDPEGKGTREGMARTLSTKLRAAYRPLERPDGVRIDGIIRDALDRLG